MLAIIGGSGLSRLPGLDITHRQVMRTPYGEPSCPLSFGQIAGRQIVFLARHGYGHSLAPHEINYRANIWALAEIGVRITNIWVIARLRNHIFHSCAEINQAIAPLNEIINNKKSRRLMGKCRRELFVEIEATHLQPLPSQRHE